MKFGLTFFLGAGMMINTNADMLVEAIRISKEDFRIEFRRDFEGTKLSSSWNDDNHIV